MKNLIKLNLASFVLFLLIQPLNQFDGFLVFRVVRSVLELNVALILVGINSTAIMQILIRQRLQLFEYLAIASVLSLLVSPLLLTLEFTQLNFVAPWLPIVNSFLTFLILLFLVVSNDNLSRKLLSELDIGSFKKTKGEIIEKFLPVLLVLVFYLALSLIIVLAFYSLPDLDPYYWLKSSRDLFKKNEVGDINSHRPLFFSLIYIFHATSSIDLYACIKYVLPFLTFSMILFPASLVASKFKGIIKKTVLMLLGLISASTILYLHTPIPQAIVITLAFYSFFFLIYSRLSRKSLYYFITGPILFFSYFYQESLAIVFLLWLIVTLVFYRKRIVAITKENKLAVSLVIIILITNISHMAQPLNFMLLWASDLLFNLNVKFNLLFPAYYINIDGNFMGWENWAGVIKYYLYYVGVGTIVLFVLTVALLFKDEGFRRYVATELLQKKEILLIFTSFIAFFTIAEIFPRFLNIAFLPERIWIFGGIFSSIFLVFLMTYYKKGLDLLYVTLIIAFILNVGGAVYINNQKKYIITKEQLASAEWINNNLPKDRVFFSEGNKNFLENHAQSKVIHISNDSYYNLDSYNNEYESKINSLTQKNSYLVYLKNVENMVKDLAKRDFDNEKKEIQLLIKKNEEGLTKLKSTVVNKRKEQINSYVYYSRVNPRNPYISRPYYKKINEKEGSFVFNKYPNKFERVYFDEKAGIIIWKIL